ncbi:MAG: tRNA (N6-isopentenyl adenosine(37)-C2)-methylthiotransferase MiaB [bacterium]
MPKKTIRYHIVTYGCQMNKSDSERIAGLLESIGYCQSLTPEKADLLVLNACSVRQSAIDRIYGWAKKLQSNNRKPKTILTGCILEKDKKRLEQRFDLVLSIKDLPVWPEKLTSKTSINTKTDNGCEYLKTPPLYQTKFSANVPVSSGCNNFCSYCVVPYARGKETCRPAKEIIKEVKNLVNKGYKEIWLLGQNVNSYRAPDNKKIDFPALLIAINKLKGNFWIRFTSSHPKDFSDRLIKTMAECEKVTESLNLPVQSGDDEVLKKMKRPYTVAHYKKLIRKIRKAIPNITLSTDIIVGFPGETKKQFQNSLKLFKEIKFDMAYIAEYSQRNGTAAAKLKDNVSLKEKKSRQHALTQVLRKTALEKNQVYIGKEIVVLSEKWDKGYLSGKSREYKSVKFNGKKSLVGKFVKVRVTSALPWGLKGELAK